MAVYMQIRLWAYGAWLISYNVFIEKIDSQIMCVYGAIIKMIMKADMPVNFAGQSFHRPHYSFGGNERFGLKGVGCIWLVVDQ